VAAEGLSFHHCEHSSRIGIEGKREKLVGADDPYLMALQSSAQVAAIVSKQVVDICGDRQSAHMDIRRIGGQVGELRSSR
jgi:hypothetical protein